MALVKTVELHVDVLSEYLILKGNCERLASAFSHPLIPENASPNALYANAEIYYDDADFTLWDELLRTGGNAFFAFLNDVIKSKVAALESYALRASSIPWESETPSELQAEFKRYFDLSLDFGPCMTMPVLVEHGMQNQAREIVKKHFPNDAERAFIFFTSPTDETATASEQRELSQLAAQRAKPEFPNLVREHVRKYAFLGLRTFEGRPWSNADVLGRLEQTGNKPVLPKLQSFADAGLSSDEKEFLVNVREMVFLRTRRLEALNRGCYAMRPALFAAAKKTGLAYEDIIMLTPDELLALLGGKKPDAATVAERKRAYALTYENRDVRVLHGNAALALQAKLRKHEEQRTPVTNELHGIPASPGHVTGIAHVIEDLKRLHEFKEGHILVTTMTTPDFVPIMQKAKAIVTDLGGITSHAAIVSRELGVVCIVGTRNATKVIKTGDRIEVDATKGVVRKL